MTSLPPPPQPGDVILPSFVFITSFLFFHTLFTYGEPRLSWWLRSPTHRIIWMVAKLFGMVATRIRWITGKPTGVYRFTYNLVEIDAMSRVVTPPSRPQTFADTFHRDALPIMVKSFLHSEIQDFVFALPWAANLEKKLSIQRQVGNCPPLPLTIVVVGLPRTGSTRFHHLCGVHPVLRTIKSWEFKMPVQLSDAPADVSARKIKTQNMLDFFYRWAPSIRAVHYVRHDDPDECVQGFMDCCFPENYLWGAVDAPEAYEWYMKGDMTAQYRNYVDLLRVVLAADEKDQTRNSILLLKSPHHIVKMPEIVNAFGGPSRVKFIWLHRDVAASVGSCCSMNQAILDVISSQYVDSHVLGARTLDRLVQAITKGQQDRKTLETIGCQFVDVHFNEFKRNEIAIVNKVLQELGIHVSPQHATEFVNNVAALDAKDQHVSTWKEHKYDLAHFGLDAMEIQKRFDNLQ